MPVYEMHVQGRLDQRWSTWFDGLTISYEGEDSTVLRGSLVIAKVFSAKQAYSMNSGRCGSHSLHQSDTLGVFFA